MPQSVEVQERWRAIFRTLRSPDGRRWACVDVRPPRRRADHRFLPTQEASRYPEGFHRGCCCRFDSTWVKVLAYGYDSENDSHTRRVVILCRAPNFKSFSRSVAHWARANCVLALRAFEAFASARRRMRRRTTATGSPSPNARLYGRQRGRARSWLVQDNAIQ